ncbi:hypothetical protein [Oxalobacter aliiformigenes]|nr:hypothetical protein [Oxalobacter aliiformigenes]
MPASTARHTVNRNETGGPNVFILSGIPEKRTVIPDTSGKRQR